MRLRIEEGESVIEAIIRCSEGRLSIDVDEPRGLVSMGCLDDEPVELDRDQLFEFIQELTETAESMPDYEA